MNATMPAPPRPDAEATPKVWTPPSFDYLQDGAGNFRCTRCGSSQLKDVRSTGRKVAFGVASLLGSTNELRCVNCNARYKRR